MDSLQKRLAAKVLKVGKSRVWLDPKKMKDIEKAITRIDIKKLIKQNSIRVLPEKLHVRKLVKKERLGRGRKKGSKYAKLSKKDRWMATVRPLRRMLKELKTSQEIDNPTYKKMRGLVKGGMFRSRTHLRLYLEQHGLMKKK